MKRKQNQKRVMKVFLVCFLGVALGLEAKAAPPETDASISAPLSSSDTSAIQEEQAWKALEKEQENTQETADKEEEDILDESQITCEHLIAGDLEVKGDARANMVCDQAMLSCLGYISLRRAIQNRTNSFSKGTTRALLKSFKEDSRK